MNISFIRLNETHFKGIIELETHLWGGDENYRTSLFYWKYVNNPFPDKLMGAVAICDGKIVGFRGLVPNYWSFKNKNLKNVHYTDAVVHPNFRGHKILAKLNIFLSDLFKDEFDFIIVLLPNSISGQIYSTQGAKPFSKVTNYKKVVFRPTKKIYIDVIVDKELIWNSVLSCNKETGKCFTFDLTESYYFWKINEPNKKFIFISNRDDGEFCYALIELRNNNIEVCDFGYRTSFNDVLNLLENYCSSQKKYYINFPIYENQKTDVLSHLNKRGYQTFSWLSKVKKQFQYSKDLLIKPFTINDKGEGLLIQELDINQASSWEFKHLYYV